MGFTHQVAFSVLCLGLLQTAVGFVRSDATSEPAELPGKGFLRNVSLPHLTSGYLERIYPDVLLLKISNSKIEKIDQHAFDHLTHLNLLEISDNEIHREIHPQTFSRLPGLEILVLRNVGMHAVQLNLTNVQHLVLAENEIETCNGSLITGKNVKFLDLSNNKIKFLAGSFANMSKLAVINLSKNKISEVSDAFKNNGKLLEILASENKITSTKGLNLPWLKTLNLFGNEIAILDSNSFSQMKDLNELILAFNNISLIEDAFKDLVELKYLNLAWNHIENLHSGLFRNNLYLTQLSLQGNKIKSLEAFQNIHYHLAHLDLSHNQLVLIDHKFFASVPNLQILDLSFNRLKTLADVLAPLENLKVLNLAYNYLVMNGYELTTNHQLTRLNLSSNNVQKGLTQFKKNQLLIDLDLSNNSITRFCDESVSLQNLLKLSLRGNLIENLSCLKHFKSLCQVDLRGNPLACGSELDSLLMNLAEKKNSPHVLGSESSAQALNQCENLSLNRSFGLWNLIKQELCPKSRELRLENGEDFSKTEEWESTEDEETQESTREPAAESVAPKEVSRQKPHIVLPIGYIGNDEMNKPNPMQKPQSERISWENIEENGEVLKGFEDEETLNKPRFSWYTIALILIGLSLTLTCFNVVMFLFIRMKVWKRADMNSLQKYTILHNEVYRNTTEPSQFGPIGEGDWTNENQTKNKIFAYGKINEILLNFGLRSKDKDSESAKNILSSAQNC